jgi:hypothetical protein
MTTVVQDLDAFWDDFLPFVEERRVVPIIGPELVLVDVDGERKPLYSVVADRLAQRLGIGESDVRGARTLNEVVCRFLAARGRKEDVYPKIRSIMKDLVVAPPEPLRTLARIRDFDLFVSLSFDSLLVESINLERFGGAVRTEHLAYAPNKADDLPAERAFLAAPVVYSLLGKLSIAPDYVITEEDMLEFLYSLQSEPKRPHLLFDELQRSNLLILGATFPDWVTRFFIRIAKSNKLSLQRSESELLVDRSIQANQPLVVFLESFSYGTRVVSADPERFVSELEARWRQRNPQPTEAERDTGRGGTSVSASLPELPAGGIFLSYAREDAAAAANIQTALTSAGLEVWFDENRLEAGDQYDQKIKRGIRVCALFVPIISRNTERRLEGYFRREWKLATERALGIAEQVPFILPVVVDDTSEYSDAVPEAFQRAQWTRLPGGAVSPEFQTRLVTLVREHRKREKGLA